MATQIPDTQEYVDIPSSSDEHEQNAEEEKEVNVAVEEPGSSRTDDLASVPDKDKDKDTDAANDEANVSEVSTLQVFCTCSA